MQVRAEGTEQTQLLPSVRISMARITYGTICDSLVVILLPILLLEIYPYKPRDLHKQLLCLIDANVNRCFYFIIALPPPN